MKLYGGIEAGGTKFVCSVGSAPDKIEAKLIIPTTSPEETLAKVVQFFKSQPEIASLGLCSFGPLNLDQQSPNYGYITSTPKVGWSDTNLLGIMRQSFNVPIAIDTDVNGAALGEFCYGAGRELNNIAFVNVGTGIGVGIILDGKVIKGISNLEIGHTLIPRLADDDIPSSCQYHDSCLEGLACGKALAIRGGKPAEEVTDDAIWDVEAHYLAVGITNIFYSFLPEKIIMGGGVMLHEGLIERVRLKIPEIMAGYEVLPQIKDEIEKYIILPGLGKLSGITGALSMAQNIRETTN